MSNIAVSNDWPAGVYQYAIGDVLDGGAESSEVLPFKQLANRSLFQRLANITPWDSALAAEFGYPNKACVMHTGLSWRAVEANNVEPGTDVTKWERWAFSASELASEFPIVLPYGAPVVCPNTGPDGAADKALIHKSALGEYWMWLGDVWKVVAGHYVARLFQNESIVVPNNTTLTLSGLSHTVVRNGVIDAVAGINWTTGSGSKTIYLNITLNGVAVGAGNNPHFNTPPPGSWASFGAANGIVVAAGDVIRFGLMGSSVSTGTTTTTDSKINISYR